MKISTYTSSPYIVLIVKGKVNTENNHIIKEHLESEIAKGNIFLGLDLSKAAEMDSETLGIIIKFWKLLKEKMG